MARPTLEEDQDHALRATEPARDCERRARMRLEREQVGEAEAEQAPAADAEELAAAGAGRAPLDRVVHAGRVGARPASDRYEPD
jgi:hypothetical protein